jgi:transcriptional regulator of acetoin/glycerol metabolism
MTDTTVRPDLSSDTPEAPPFAENYHESRDGVLAWFEARYARWLVAHAKGNIAAAARTAGIERTTVYRLLRRSGIERAANSH